MTKIITPAISQGPLNILPPRSRPSTISPFALQQNPLIKRRINKIDSMQSNDLKIFSEIFKISISTDPLTFGASTKHGSIDINDKDIKNKLKSLNDAQLNSLIATASMLSTNFKSCLEILNQVKKERTLLNNPQSTPSPYSLFIDPTIRYIESQEYRKITAKYGQASTDIISLMFPVRSSVNQYPIKLLFLNSTNDNSILQVINIEQANPFALYVVNEDDDESPRVFISKNANGNNIMNVDFFSRAVDSVRFAKFNELEVNPNILIDQNTALTTPQSTPSPYSLFIDPTIRYIESQEYRKITAKYGQASTDIISLMFPVRSSVNQYPIKLLFLNSTNDNSILQVINIEQADPSALYVVNEDDDESPRVMISKNTNENNIMDVFFFIGSQGKSVRFAKFNELEVNPNILINQNTALTTPQSTPSPYSLFIDPTIRYIESQEYRKITAKYGQASTDIISLMFPVRSSVNQYPIKLLFLNSTNDNSILQVINIEQADPSALYVVNEDDDEGPRMDCYKNPNEGNIFDVNFFIGGIGNSIRFAKFNELEVNPNILIDQNTALTTPQSTPSPSSIIFDPDIISIDGYNYKKITAKYGAAANEVIIFNFPIRDSLDQYPVYILFNNGQNKIELDFNKDKSSVIYEITENDGDPRIIISQNPVSNIIDICFYTGISVGSKLLEFNELSFNPDIIKSALNTAISSTQIKTQSALNTAISSTQIKTQPVTYTVISTPPATSFNQPDKSNSSSFFTSISSSAKIITLEDLTKAIDGFCREGSKTKLFDYLNQNLFNSDNDNLMLFNNTAITTKNIEDFQKSILNANLKLTAQLKSASPQEREVINEQIAELQKVSKGLTGEDICKDDKEKSSLPIVAIITATVVSTVAVSLVGFLYYKCKASNRQVRNQDQELETITGNQVQRLEEESLRQPNSAPQISSGNRHSVRPSSYIDIV